MNQRRAPHQAERGGSRSKESNKVQTVSHSLLLPCRSPLTLVSALTVTTAAETSGIAATSIVQPLPKGTRRFWSQGQKRSSAKGVRTKWNGNERRRAAGDRLAFLGGGCMQLAWESRSATCQAAHPPGVHPLSRHPTPRHSLFTDPADRTTHRVFGSDAAMARRSLNASQRKQALSRAGGRCGEWTVERF